MARWLDGPAAWVVGRRLIEVVFRHGFRFGGIEGRCLIEKEVPLRRAAGRREWGYMGQAQVQEDSRDDGWIGEKGEDPHLSTTARTQKRQHPVDPCEKHGPADACRTGWTLTA